MGLIVIIISIGGGVGGSPPENFFLNCFKMVHFHGSSIIMLLLGAYIWALGQYGLIHMIKGTFTMIIALSVKGHSIW